MYTLGFKELCLIMVANRTLTIGCSLLSFGDAQVGVHGWRFVNYSQALRKIFSNRCQSMKLLEGQNLGCTRGLEVALREARARLREVRGDDLTLLPSSALQVLI